MLLGFALISLAVGTVTTLQVKADEPLCYLRTEEGNTIDLSHLCGYTPSNSHVEESEEIDLNAPVEINLPVSDTPSQLWNSIPNLPQSPVQGETIAYTPPANSSSTTAPSAGFHVPSN